MITQPAPSCGSEGDCWIVRVWEQWREEGNQQSVYLLASMNAHHILAGLCKQMA